MKAKKTSEYDRFLALSDSQKNKEVARYDREMPGLPGKALTPAEKALHTRARGRGRPRIGKGSKTIALTMELDLLRRADERAKSEGISRAQLIAKGLQLVLR